jgi:ketosteroid isomerase-like protein
MDQHPNAEVVRRAFEAFAAGDLDDLGRAFTDDVVWHVPGTNRFSGRFEGRATAMDRLRRMEEAGVQTTLEVHDVVANDEHAVSLVHLHVRNAQGQRYDQQQVQVWHMRDGRCHEYWAMNEDQAVLDLLLGSS